MRTHPVSRQGSIRPWGSEARNSTRGDEGQSKGRQECALTQLSSYLLFFAKPIS